MPVAKVSHRSTCRRGVAEIFRRNRQGLGQSLAVRNIEASAVEVGEHPFVTIKAITIRQLEAAMDPAKLFAQSGRASHSRIYVQPYVVFAANRGDFRQRIESER